MFGKAIKKTIGRAVVLLLLVGLICALVYGIRGYQTYQKVLSECSISQKVADLQGESFYRSLDQMPEIYPEIVLAAEDHRFYKHQGIDPVGLLRAVWNNIRTFSLREGGSTITQQLAKNLYFSNARSAERKVAEGFMALALERELEKDQILELYINCIYYGGGQYCLYDAAQFYFEKDPMDLSLSEMALLAGLPNAPSAYAPHVNPELAEQRRLQVVDKMERYEVVGAVEAEALRKETVVDRSGD